jgi:hypothetical protein
MARPTRAAKGAKMTRDRSLIFRCASVAVAITSGLVAGRVWAQPPDGAGQASAPCERKGLFHRFLHHSAHTIHDRFIGYPDTFIEPPLGYYNKEMFSMQVSKADPHRFTLYRSDFLPGTDRFSPTGASRFNLMYSRLQGWMGPITVEWTPDEPGLADARRQVILATLQRAGRPVVAERVVVGPSPFPGANISGLAGNEAANNLNGMIIRSQQAAMSYPPTPQSGAYAYSTAQGVQ